MVSSTDARFKAGDEVICTSYDFGVAHDGGYAQVRAACRPTGWCRCPQGLTLFEAMALGTAGYTAGLAIELLELNGLAPGNGKVLVNGATGGVATLAIDMLARLGYTVVAVTGKDAEHEFLKELGARGGAVAARRSTWATGRWRSRCGRRRSIRSAASSSRGSRAPCSRTALIASFGNAGGIELKTTVLPFILRGVRLIGVDSGVHADAAAAQGVAAARTDLKPRHLGDIAHTIALDDLPAYFDKHAEGAERGGRSSSVNVSDVIER